MTQKYQEYLFPPEQSAATQHSYADGLPSMSHPSSGDYMQEQYGGGRRHESPLVELTPTRLRSTIKATHRDVGVVRDAAIRRQETQLLPDAHSAHSSAPSGMGSLHTTHDNPGRVQVAGATSPPTLPSVKSHPLSHPAALQDMFYNPISEAPPGWLMQDSDDFDSMMSERSFTAMLMETQDHFLASAAYSGLDDALTTNVIPPTPLKGTSLTSGLPDPSHIHDRCDPDASADVGGNQVHENTPQGERFIPGRKSADVHMILETGFVKVEESLLHLSEATSMPLQQVINCFLKSRGRTTVSINFWNIYARSYFKDHVEQELARVHTVIPADGGSPSMF